MASSFTYQLMPKNTILRSDGKYVPVTFFNADFQLFLKDCLAKGLCKEEDITEGSLVLPEPDGQLLFGAKEKTLDEQKRQAKVEIDEVAATTRACFITIAHGQELTYYDKVDEAMDYVADGYPEELDDYPYLKAEALARQISGKQAATIIIEARSRWVATNSEIERIRLSGKHIIDTSKNGTTISQTQKHTIEQLIKLQQ